MSSKPPRHLRWGLPESPIPKHPYRDTMLVYGFFAVLVVLLAWLTGGNIPKSIVVAFVVWLAASVWGIARWRQRIQREEARRLLAEEEL
jgi:membrane protein implicated in regulation of membrane protease activity